jgi:hypothetical protein
VFRKGVLREIFAPKCEEGPGNWKKNCIMMSSLICTCHFSPNVIRVVQSGRLNWAELVGSMEKKRNEYMFVRKT